MNKYDVIIGIEIHVELNTKSKMFADSPIDINAKANTMINEIDLGHPGILPSVNKEAVKKALKVCHALNMEIDPLVRFDRKNYYYSDLVKGYQITQQFNPIGKNGKLELDSEFNKTISINRLHLEEDTAKQFHFNDYSLIDFNRSGIPLIEIVSNADMSSANEAMNYVQNLRRILVALDVSDGRMENGSMRADINISIKEKNDNKLGAKVEIKNINSISNIKNAIEFEIKRQSDLLDKGEKIIQSTRRYDDKNNCTVLMRLKESAIDYRYFPEANIMPIKLSDDFINDIKTQMPKLPKQLKKEFINDYMLNEIEADILIDNKELMDYFLELIKDVSDFKMAFNMLNTNLLAYLNKSALKFSDLKFPIKELAKIINYQKENKISSSQAKEILEILINENKGVDLIIAEKGIKQLSDQDEIRKMVISVLENNPKSIEDFKNGKDRAFSYLNGQIMKLSKGKVNPKLAAQILAEEIKNF